MPKAEKRWKHPYLRRQLWTISGPGGEGTTYVWTTKRFVKGPRVAWDFDLTDVSTGKAWRQFLDRWGFVKVDESPPGLQSQKKRVYKNAQDVFIMTTGEPALGTATPLDPQSVAMGYGYKLGYVWFEAPKKQEFLLKDILLDFRGPNQVKVLDAFRKRGEVGGIAMYVKEETPHAERRNR